MRTFFKISMASMAVIGVTMIYLAFTRFAYEYVIGFTLFCVGLILLVVTVAVFAALLDISSRNLEIIKRIAKKLALVGVILAILIFGQWLIFASVDSPHGSVPLGSTIRLPLFGTVAHYDKIDEIRVKRSFFSKETTIKMDTIPKE